MFIEYIIVEPCISYSKAGKLPSISVLISATLDSSCDKSILKQLLIEESSVSTKITDQVAYFSSNTIIFMLDQNLKLVVEIGLMNVFVELF